MASTIRLGGLFSGIDTESIIQRILDVSRIPIKQLEGKDAVLDVQNSAAASLKKSLVALQTSLTNLRDSSFFSSSSASTSDSTVATATASVTAAKSQYTFLISSIASASVHRSGTASGDKVAHSIDATALLGSDGAYGSSLTLGTFTVNGATVTIDGTDTLNSTLNKISVATGGAVTGSYSAVTDKITLTSGSTVILGGGGDTSNFLSRSRLYTNGTGSVASLTSIGIIDTTQTIGTAASGILNQATLTTGNITVNGVSVAIDKDNDTLQNVLDRIAASSAGVYASYDSIEDRIILTSKSTGSIGITVTDDTSNFASQMKLTTATGQLTQGNNTVFTVNGGVSRVSTDTVISDVESGVAGLTVSAIKTGTATITVSSDSSKIKTEVDNFVSQYNSLQNQIKSFTNIAAKGAAPTDASSILTGDTLVAFLGNDLRKRITQSVGSGTYRMLADFGVNTNSTDQTLTASDSSKLSAALATNASEVSAVFMTISSNLNTFINTQTDTVTGSFSKRITDIAKQKLDHEDRIEQILRNIENEESRLITSFSALEEFQAKSQNILSFLQSRK
jgi:flagellar hook-associated protein 2